MGNEPNKIIYSMIGVSKYYDKKPILKDIYLSYFYGAKIGVLGLNGSGKSSLLRILAGMDKEFNGETVLSPGHTVGLLEQEPKLDDKKTVREIVEEGVHEIVDALKEYNLINEKFAEPMSDDEMNKLIERQGRSAGEAGSAGMHGTLIRALRWPWMPCAVLREKLRSMSSPEGKNAVSHSADCSCRSRIFCFWTSRPTISMQRPWPGLSTICKAIRALSLP